MRPGVAVLIGCSIAASLGPSGARASSPELGAHAVGGVVVITLERGCPEQFRVPFAGTSNDGALWTFTLDGFQVPCTPRYMEPVVFQGPYSPTAPPCDRRRGNGCPQSIDRQRPGYLSLGTLPRAHVLQVTTARFCVSARCYQGKAFGERLAGSTGRAEVIDPLVGAIAGVAEVTPPGCAPGAMRMGITALSDGGPVWLSVRPAAVAVDCGDPVVGATNVFLGDWSPSRGGCIPSVTYPGSSVCMSRVPIVLGNSTVGVAICFPGPSCWSGSATVMRA